MSFTPLTKGDFKNSVKAAADVDVTVANPGTSTFDGVVLSSGNRLLLKSQSAGAQNGIYKFNGAGVPLTRVDDMDTPDEATPGLLVYAEQGTVNGGKWWYLSTTGTITIGSTALTFTQLGGGTSGINDINSRRSWFGV